MTKPDFLNAPAIQAAFRLAIQAGGEGRLVGGVVRDWLMGRPVGDIDMAVNVPIDAFCKAAEKANIRIIETGLDHGSVTMIYENDSIEITQTRADIETDGRHALIGFHPSFATDASRRDFTMNAIYLNADGALYDPLNGQEDIHAKKVVFIGNASDRITEDYLRILRYVRFIATLDDIVIDEGILSALTQHKQGLRQLSGERIMQELIKLFAGPHWAKAVDVMRHTALDTTLFNEPFLDVLDMSDSLDKWQARVASCLSPSAFQAWQNLPVARKDVSQIKYCLASLSEDDWACLAGEAWHEIAYFEPHNGGQVGFYDRCLVQSRYHPHGLSSQRLQALRNYDAPPCPVTGHDLQQAGFEAGPEMGKVLHQAKRAFAKSAYSLSREEIIALLRS